MPELRSYKLGPTLWALKRDKFSVVYSNQRITRRSLLHGHTTNNSKTEPTSLDSGFCSAFSDTRSFRCRVDSYRKATRIYATISSVRRWAALNREVTGTFQGVPMGYRGVPVDLIAVLRAPQKDSGVSLWVSGDTRKLQERFKGHKVSGEF